MKKIILILFTPLFCFSWTKSVEDNKMNDSKFVQISTKSKNKIKLSVLIDCKNDEYFLLLTHSWIVTRGPAKFRIDKLEPVGIYSEPSNDSKVLKLGDSTSSEKNPKWIIDQMIKHNNFLIQFNQAGGKLIEAEFDIKGLDQQLKKTCN